MPLSDGTNAEKEDVSPPVDWKTKADIKDVVLHSGFPSPPCTKTRLLLKYYEVPFRVKDGLKKGSAYKRIPVIDASGRQINDSYIIFKTLVPILCGAPFNEEWQMKITYKLQPAIEIEVMEQKPGDMAKFVKSIGAPGCIAGCIGPPIGRKYAAKVKKENPDCGTSVEVGKAFAEAMGSQNFFGGDKPDQVDIAYYGTLVEFASLKFTGFQDHIDESGLVEWWSRMEAVMPKWPDIKHQVTK